VFHVMQHVGPIDHWVFHSKAFALTVVKSTSLGASR
jgi:hypothetical protein